MIFISILSLIVAKALPSLNINLPSVYFIRISAIIFIYAGVLSFNTLYIQSIGSGIGIYSGLFQVTVISHYIEVFLLLIGFLILIAWPLSTTKNHLSFNHTDRIQPSLSEITPLSYLSEGHHSNSREELVGVEGVLSSIQVMKDGDKTGEGSTAIKDSGINKALQFIVADKTSQINQTLRGGKDYSLIVLFSTLGSCLLISSSDLVSMYLSIELQSFGLYVLATLYRDSESSTSAGLKYFLLGGLSSCLILLGSGLIYAFTGLTQFESIYSLISVLDVNNITQGLSLGLILIFVGFLFKIAAAPLHNWSPDVYDETPTIVTIWLTIMPKIAILILLLEIYTQSSPGVGGIEGVSYYGEDLNVTLNYLNLESLQLKENSISLLKSLLLISSLLSLIIGTVVGLAQTRIKRLLAYSTISHIGFILLALAINTEQSIDSLIFYIIQYSISNLNIFLIIIALSYIFMNTSPTYPPYDSSVTSPLEVSQEQVKVSPLSDFTAGEKEGVDRSEGPDRQTLGVVNVRGNTEGHTILKGDTGRLEVNTNKNSIDIRYISELKGQFLLNPLLSLSLAICLFSMAGIPPLIGFFSKQFVLYSALGSGYYFMSFVCIIVSVISASYYLKIIKVLYSSDPDTFKGPSLRLRQAPTAPTDPFPTLSTLKEGSYGTFPTLKEGQGQTEGPGQVETRTQPLSKSGSEGHKVQTGFNNTNLSNFHSFLISTLTLFILLFLFKPSLILNSTKLLSLSLFYN